MNLGKEDVKRLRGLIAFTILLFVAIWNYRLIIEVIIVILGILSPFMIGGAIAFILNVPMNFLERKLFRGSKKKGIRGLSLLMTLAFILGILALVVFVVVPELANTLVKIGTNIQDFIPQTTDQLDNLFKNNKLLQGWVDQLDWQSYITKAIDFIRNGAGDMLASTFDVARGVISGVASFVIGFVFACYVLLQKEKLILQIKKMLKAYLSEKRGSQILYFAGLTYESFANFLTGQCVEAVIIGTLFFVGMTIFRLPYAMLVGLTIAICSLIPIFGYCIGCVMGTLFVLMVNPVQAVGFLILFVVIQQVETNLIYPKVVGGSIGLPAIWVLVAVSVGGSLFGILGMLIFIPMTSVFYTLLRKNMYKKLKMKTASGAIAGSEELSEESSGKTENKINEK